MRRKILWAAFAPQAAFPLLAATLSAVLCVFVNRHTLGYGFIPFDENLQVVFNGHLGWPSRERLAWMFLTTGYNGYYMPLDWLSLTGIYMLSGLHPEGYHAALVGFHALNGVLLFVLIRRMVRAVAPRLAPASGAPWTDACALLGSLWWSLNPLRVESTAWISGLGFAQATSFAFASVIVHLGPASQSGADATGARPSGWARPALATVLYACSLLTYPVALGLAPVFFVIDKFAGRRAASPGKAGFVVVAAVVLAVSLQAARKTGEHFQIAEAHLPLSIRAGRAAYALSYYVWKPWIPARLSYAYPATLARPGPSPGSLLHPFWSAQIIEGVSATILLAAACAFCPRFRRTLGPFFLCHVLLLAPMTGITINGDYVTHDRYCGLACGAWAVGVAILLLHARPWHRALVAAASCAGLLLLARMSERQTAVWRDGASVWANAAAHIGPDQFPELQYYDPAYVLKMSGQYDEAAAVVARGLSAMPGDQTLLALGRDIAECRTLYPRFCPFAEVHVSLAHWFMKTQDWREADEHLRVALELSPNFAEAAYDRALVRLDLGQYSEALHDFIWAEARMPAPFSPAQRQAVLDLVAREARAAGDLPLASAVSGGPAPAAGRK